MVPSSRPMAARSRRPPPPQAKRLAPRKQQRQSVEEGSDGEEDEKSSISSDSNTTDSEAEEMLRHPKVKLEVPDEEDKSDVSGDEAGKEDEEEEEEEEKVVEVKKEPGTAARARRLGERRFQCDVCVFGTDKEETFKMHQRRHKANSCDGSSKFFCKLCGAGFARYEQVRSSGKLTCAGFFCTKVTCRKGSTGSRSTAVSGPTRRSSASTAAASTRP